MSNFFLLKFPNYLAESLSKVKRFHDPQGSPTLSGLTRSSSTDSLDSVSASFNNLKVKEFGQVTNTVKAIERKGPEAGQVKTFQLPSLITPVSLFGKRIR